MKQTIRLTENELHNLIKESVNNILSELDWRTAINASQEAKSKSLSDDYNKYDKEKFNRQRKKFMDYTQDRYHSQYNLDPNLEYTMRNMNYKPTNGELKNLSKREEDEKNYYSDKSEYRNGKWRNKKTVDSDEPWTTHLKKYFK